jgi:hypothetical protein
MTLHRIAGLLALAGTLSACVSSTEPETALTVGLDTREVSRDSVGNAVIPFRVSNAGTATVYLQTCGGFVTADVQQRVGSAWATAASAFGCFSSIYLGPRQLGPGETTTGTQSVRLGPGEYRLRVLLSLDPQGEPTRSVTSDVITVR